MKQCLPIHRCWKCQRSHHTWLNLKTEANAQTQTNTSPSLSENTPGNVMSHTSQLSDHHRRVLLMTCQVRVIASESSTGIARALSDLASCTCFITECLAHVSTYRNNITCWSHSTCIYMYNEVPILELSKHYLQMWYLRLTIYKE